MTATRRVTLVVCSLLLGSCSDSPSGPTPPAAATIKITAAGLVPTEVRIRTGEQVSFLNNDTRPHEISSDPIEVHSDCPGVNEVGLLSPGESRTTRTLIVPRSCGFHDHLNQTDSAWKGRIVVQ